MADVFDILNDVVDSIETSTSRAQMLISGVQDESSFDGVFLKRPEFQRAEIIHPQVFHSDVEAQAADMSSEAGRKYAAASAQINLMFGGK